MRQQTASAAQQEAHTLAASGALARPEAEDEQEGPDEDELEDVVQDRHLLWRHNTTSAQPEEHSHFIITQCSVLQEPHTRPTTAAGGSRRSDSGRGVGGVQVQDGSGGRRTRKAAG